MAKPIETLSIQLKFKDAGSQAVIEKLKGSLKRLELGASGAKPEIEALRREILAQGSASVTSVANIQAQATALRALRDEAEIGGATFKKLTADIKKLDAQMGKSAKSSAQRGMGARRATQTAGAIISGGIFGGPEGAIGGALGALGGVEGAFAGAAIGAQVGMLRQAVGDMADYAATIEKAKIALNGVLPNQNDFNFALQVASQATKELNVPQDQSIQGITRLAAAVTGAKGPVSDAALTFRNVTAAIKATGGSSEDVRGAITAMVQVFSKGKVSAEELSGQLGERLPGAVTMFAEANKMTLPELQENLKAGTVGLNELMNFIVELGNKYNSTAKKISDSNAEAGARLSVAIRDMQADVGAALIPIGAQFQAAFAEFIREITPHLVEFLPKIGNLFLGLAKNIDTVVVAALAALGVFGIAKLVAIATAVKGITAAVATLKAGMVALGLANPFTAIAVTAAALAGYIYNAAKEQKRLNVLIKEGTVAQVQPVLTQKIQQRDELLRQQIQLGGRTDRLAAQFQEGGQKFKELQQLNQDIANLRERLVVAPYDETQGADLDLNFLRGQFRYDPVKPEEGSGKGTDSLKAIREQQRLLNKIADIEQKILETNRRGREAAQGKVQSLTDELALLQESDPIKRIQLEFEQKRAQAHRETVAAIEATDDPMQMQLANQKLFLELEVLSVKEQQKLKEAAEETNTVFDSIKQTVEQGLTNAIMGLIDGTKSLSESLSGVLRQMAQIFVQAGTSSLLGAVGFADGGVIAKNKIVPFAYGGIVNKPTLFPMANGAGLMGEAGPEAIMPLRRGRDGKLGVEASGGVGNVVVNVDASGSRVQGDQPNAKALGSAIGAAVQAEIVRQKRPGGLLS